ncbi:cyclin-D4-1 isoform X2 [Arachis hypogaea]|uniref:B-like cyclin n=1 Tax=Arachis hypogaea TaxID=3818 RepID=A0A6B9VEI1_ARAHY|nr:cyclin-D4-1 isoform X2 [Arachis hypogaea]QHN79853.1 Cyclin [Arachis hypogaea]
MSSSSASMLCVEDASEAISDHPSPPSLTALWQPYDDDSDISELIDAEARHMASADYLRRCGDGSVDVSARLDAINWMLKVQAFYEFHPVTAFLSINYMDRFLSLVSLPVRSRWAFQLLSVACLSVAAKMEEPQVPLLLDLQLFQPTLVFHPKTLRRMELCLLSNLNWTLRSVTPFHYLHYYLTNLPSSSSSFNRLQLLSAASDLILASTRGNGETLSPTNGGLRAGHVSRIHHQSHARPPATSEPRRRPRRLHLCQLRHPFFSPPPT